MKQKILPILMALALLLSACGGDSGENDFSQEAEPLPSASVSVTAAPSLTPSPEYDGPLNPLTGLPIEEEWVNARPVAVMLNNLKQAMPQLGVAQADIIYEVLAEGGITRMLALYQTVEGVGLIGSVRSARTYYLELALGHDAIFLHAGGSPDAYDKIKSWSVTALDCVNGPYEGSLFWRDPDRIRENGRVHSVVTSGETILEMFPTYSFRKEHTEDFTYQMSFTEDGTPKDGQPATTITVPFSTYKTGVFTYDPIEKAYLAEEYGEAYIDGNTGEQVSFTNVLILQADCSLIPGDAEGRISVDLNSGGNGWFACGGQIIPICWSKDGVTSQLVYTTQTGQVLTLGAGTSYVNIIPLEKGITVS